MEENHMYSEIPGEEAFEPSSLDNSDASNQEDTCLDTSAEGQSQDPSEGLILGKFKNLEELAKAYMELQKYQGQSSQELGKLRQESISVKNLAQSFTEAAEIGKLLSNGIAEIKEKYNSPEYFQDSSFRDLYREAFLALGDSLDSDRFIDLLESYVTSRISLREKLIQAEQETQKVLDSMTYSKNPKSTFTPPKKSLDEMTQIEIDELLDRLI